MNMLSAVIIILLSVNIVALVIFWLKLRSSFSANRILGSIQSEVEKLIIDLGHEADRDVALLESRIAGLKELIDEADKRILLAEREEAKRVQARKIVSNLDVPSFKSPPPDSRAKDNEEPITLNFRRNPTPIQPLVPITDQVLDLAKRGISASVIASKLSMSLGEVELILDMHSGQLF